MIRGRKQRYHCGVECKSDSGLRSEYDFELLLGSGSKSSFGFGSGTGSMFMPSSWSGSKDEFKSHSGSNFYREYKEWLGNRSKQLRKLLGY